MQFSFGFRHLNSLAPGQGVLTRYRHASVCKERAVTKSSNGFSLQMISLFAHDLMSSFS